MTLTLYTTIENYAVVGVALYMRFTCRTLCSAHQQLKEKSNSPCYGTLPIAFGYWFFPVSI
jgi:hypothetical protein